MALYDRQAGKVSYPYYVDIIDNDAIEAEAHEYLNPDCLSLTGHVLTTGQPLMVDAGAMRRAEQEGRFAPWATAPSSGWARR